MSSFAYDPAKTPFSRAGSYLSINRLWPWGLTDGKPAGWYVRSVRRPAEIFRIAALRGGNELPLVARATPGCLTFEAEGGGTLEFCFSDHDTLRVRVRGCLLGLFTIMEPYGFAYRIGEDVRLHPGAASEQFFCRALSGQLTSHIAWTHSAWKDDVERADLILDGQQGDGELVIAASFTVPVLPADLPDFDVDARRGDAEFARFLSAFPPVAQEWAAGAALAALVLWVSTVAPEGFFRSPAVLMSKNWMTKVWSWDHCFNALGLARAYPDLAWQQFLLPFEQQDESGLLPDATGPQQVSWLGTKSPIHGWALQRLLRLGVLTKDHLREAYGPLSRWANYWLHSRNLDGSGLPYFVNGNEQFDNITLFQVHHPYRSADLAAYLVILQEVLADVAEKLGRASEALDWRKGAANLLDKIVPALWREGRFVAPRFGDNAVAEGDCLFRCTALVLGRRLPSEVTGKMVADLREPGRFRTAFGPLASEALTSPLYEEVSYVRGPIWVPPNMLIVDGLRDLGETEAADEVRDGFLRLCAREGMHENFHPRTGNGQGDPAYTWTAAAFLTWCQEMPCELSRE